MSPENPRRDLDPVAELKWEISKGYENRDRSGNAVPVLKSKTKNRARAKAAAKSRRRNK